MCMEFRTARPEEALHLAGIISSASGGIVEYLFHDLMPGLTPVELLSKAILDRESVYCYENILVASDPEKLYGLMLAYPGAKNVLPASMRDFLMESRVNTLKNLFMFMDVHGLYINSLWVDTSRRGTGLADVFMEEACNLAGREGLSRINLHVWADNSRAVNFYKRHGFFCHENCTISYHPLMPHHGGKLLLRKNLGQT